MAVPATLRGGGSVRIFIEGEFDYCERCGRKNERTERLVGFGTEDGLPDIQVRFRCPQKRWWNSHTDQYTWPRLQIPDRINVVADTP